MLHIGYAYVFHDILAWDFGCTLAMYHVRSDKKWCLVKSKD